jgi:hypothetical protein
MVGLSAAAIASVYAVGYLRTSGASDSFAATVDPTATVGALPTSPSVGMEVTVVIKDQKIVSAAVSQCGTRYSCDKVDTLTRLTVSRQAVPVDHVSGATDSSNAYKQAVAAALAKARAS